MKRHLSLSDLQAELRTVDPSATCFSMNDPYEFSNLVANPPGGLNVARVDAGPGNFLVVLSSNVPLLEVFSMIATKGGQYATERSVDFSGVPALSIPTEVQVHESPEALKRYLARFDAGARVDVYTDESRVPVTLPVDTNFVFAQPGRYIVVGGIDSDRVLYVRDYMNKFVTVCSVYMIPEYQAVLDYATTEGIELPTFENQVKQNLFLERLIVEGIWTGLDAIYVFMGSEQAFGLLNWKAPGVELTYNVGLNHDPKRGFFGKPNNTDYIQLASPTGKINYTRNSAGFGLSRGALLGNGRASFNQEMQSTTPASGPVALINTGRAINDNRSYYYNNGTFRIISKQFRARAFSHFQVLGSTAVSWWINGELYTNIAGPATAGVPTTPFYLFGQECWNEMAWFGGPLIGKQVIFNSLWETYRTSI